ncbi:MAG: minor capsid protein [Devosia sp.]
MLLAKLAALALRPEDLPDVEDLLQEALARWDLHTAPSRKSGEGADGQDAPIVVAPVEYVRETAAVREFAGRINAERQQMLGIDRYTWLSRDDERVRDSHASNDDNVFWWDEPPEDGHPGEAHNCRCVAEPLLVDEPEWVPTLDAAYDSAIDDAVWDGAIDGVQAFLSDLVPSLDDLWALLEASEAATLGYLIVKEQLTGLDEAEQTRRDGLLGNVEAWVDDLAATLGDAPELALALFDAVRAIEARPEALAAAHRRGVATRADVVAAYSERSRMRTLAALYGLSALVSGGVAARALIARLLRRRGTLPDDVAADGLADQAARARTISPDGDWARIPDPGIPWGGPIKEQGASWERHLAERGGLGDWIEERARNFKTFDFFDRVTRVATSAKTLNTRAPGYARDPRRIFYTLKRYIKLAAEFDSRSVPKYRILPGQIERRRVVLAIPSGTTAEQMREINRARTYAESKWIELEVTIIE